MPDGTYCITLSATVSLPNLISYAKNQGSECEFAGNTFGMEMQLCDLQKANERKAILNLNTQLRGLLPNLMNWEIKVEEPRIPQSALGREYIFGEELAKELSIMKDGTVNQHLFEKINAMRYDDFYEVSANIYAVEPEKDIIGETLKQISITYSEFESYQSKGLRVGSYDYYNPAQSGGYTNETLFFRNGNIRELMDSIYGTIAEVYSNFVIKDNLGHQHYLYPNEIKASTDNLNCKFDSSVGIYYGDNINVRRNFKDNRASITVVSLTDDDLYSYPVSIYSTGNYYDGFNDLLKGDYYALKLHKPKPGALYPLGGITFYIPKNAIGKYSSFKIERK